jgi:hypothetical protein
MTDFLGFGAFHLGGLIAIGWFSLLQIKDAVGGPTASASGGGADREPAFPEFYQCAEIAKNAPEPPLPASRHVRRIVQGFGR